MIIWYDGTPLTRLTTFKYLGIYINQSLSFNDHIKYIIKKVSKGLGQLRRIRGSLILQTIFTRPQCLLAIIEYFEVAWQGCVLLNVDRLERVQRRATHLINPNSSLVADSFLANLCLPLLWKRGEAHCAILAKKLVLGLVPTYFNEY